MNTMRLGRGYFTLPQPEAQLQTKYHDHLLLITSSDPPATGPNCCGYDEFRAKMMIETLMIVLVITENGLVSMIQSFINNCVWVLMPFVFLLLVVEDNLEYLHALKDVRAVTIQDSI